MNKRSRIFLLLLLTVLLCACGKAPAETATTTSPITEPVRLETQVPTVPETQPLTEPEPQPEAFTLTFVGDCTLGAHPGNLYADVGFVKTVGEDYGYPFRNVIDYFAQDEFSFANLEGPLTDEGYPVQKTHAFRGPEQFVNILTQNSVDFVSLANNHTLDYTQVGYDNTLRVLTEAQVPYVERDASTIVTTPGGLTIGVYGAVYYNLDVKDMVAEIAELRSQCDLVIYAPHWGTEETYHPTTQQVEVGHAAIDAGADIVWGSHPHALQPMEYYGDGVIFYSLANFSFGGNGNPGDFDTALVQVTVIRQPDGTVSLGEITLVPCSVSSVDTYNNFQPTPYQPGTRDYDRVLEKLAGTFTGPYGKNG